MKELEKQGTINEKRVLLNLLERKPLPKPTPLKGNTLEVTKEAVPWMGGGDRA